MKCNLCGTESKIVSGKEIKRMVNEVLEEIAIDGDKWITLYRCKQCRVYWEERYTGGRWDGWPELYKIVENDAVERWRGKTKIEE